MKTTSVLLALALSVGLLSGCGFYCDLDPEFPQCNHSGNKNPDQPDQTPPADEPDLYSITCYQGECPINSYSIEYSYIYSCFGSGTTIQSWAPGDVTTYCTNGHAGTDLCTIPLEPECDVSPTLAEDGSCVDDYTCGLAGQATTSDGLHYTDPSGYCAWDFTTAVGSLQDDYATALSELNAATAGHCSVVFTSSNAPLTITKSAHSECSTCIYDAPKIYYPGMSYGLDLNPSTSWLKIRKNGQTTLQVALDGAVAVKQTSSTKQFLFGKAIATQDGSFASWDVEDIRMYVIDPIPFSISSGTVSITKNNTLTGDPGIWLTIDGTDWSGSLVNGSTMTGTINQGNGTFSMDYTQPLGIGGIYQDIHLEGIIY